MIGKVDNPHSEQATLAVQRQLGDDGLFAANRVYHQRQRPAVQRRHDGIHDWDQRPGGLESRSVPAGHSTTPGSRPGSSRHRAEWSSRKLVSGSVMLRGLPV